MTFMRISVSRSVSEEVGSSMTISFALVDRAFATSTICRCAMDRSLTSVLTSAVRPTISV